jgi:lipopolysaccharide transport protein LptA
MGKMRTVLMAFALAAAAAFGAKDGKGLPDFLGGAGSGTNKPTRDSVITADRVEYDRKEGVILFDQNVLVDDERFTLRSEKLLVFMEGTNAVKQIMAIGTVVITNENRSASCDKAVYTKDSGQIVMTGRARLKSEGQKGGEAQGEKIVFWLDDERMEITQGSKVVLPAGALKGGAEEKKAQPK